jgi:hypothetical protein
MTTNGAVPESPAVVRRLQSTSSASLVALGEMFEDLQTVLQCCERLVEDLATDPGQPDPIAVEAVWTLALLSYARCFAAGGAGIALTEEDLTTVVPNSEVVEWHHVLTQLRDHHADPLVNPRERFSVGVTQDPDGVATGVAITSVRQPLVDDLTVRQTGAIAYALSGLVNARIEAQQELLFGELKALAREDLDQLEPIDVGHDTTGS